MSDFRAIGGVSSTLQALLADRMEWPPDAPDVPVTVGPPRFTRPEDQGKPEEARVNLFLYRVTENGYLQNQEIPGRGGNGYGHPPLSLNLHYLLTTYGSDPVINAKSPTTDEKLAHFLLGSAMRVLHDVPIVTDELATIRAPSGNAVLHPSLVDAFEPMKLMLEPLSLEDVTKVWTALSLRYRLSAAYAVHVVQIESRRRRVFPRPVAPPIDAVVGPRPGEPGPAIDVVPIRVPSINQVLVRRAGTATDLPYPYVRVDDRVVLLGQNLNGRETRVAFGETEVGSALALGGRVEAVVPDTTTFDGVTLPAAQLLQPGPLSLRVVVVDPPRRTRSNVLVVQLVPRIDATGLAAGPPRTITVDGRRLIAREIPGELLIGRSATPAAEYLAAATDSITARVPDTVPSRAVRAYIGGSLPASVPMGPQPQEMKLSIDGVPRTIKPAIPSPVDRTAIPAILQGAIRDTAAGDFRFRDLRVGLLGDALVLVPGGLGGTIVFAAVAPSTLVGDLGLGAAQPPGAGTAAISGELVPFPPSLAADARISVTIGAASAALGMPFPTDLADLASKLQTAIAAANPAPAFANCRVGVLERQLLVVPGANTAVTFGPDPADATSVATLRLRAPYAIRVRANGAESIDDIAIEFPS
jgi:hypothetical protein